MTLFFSANPGAHERQLQRRYNNPLFPASRREVSMSDVEQARRCDSTERQKHNGEFRALLDKAVNLGGNEDTEVILDLKQEIDRLYVECMSLGGDTEKEQTGLIKIHDVIMNTIRQSAGNDRLAIKELDKEQQARQVHLELMQHPLVAHLLRKDSPIEEDELIPTLLSENIDSIRTVVTMLDESQLDILCHGGRELLSTLEKDGLSLPMATRSLEAMEGHLQLLR